MTFNEKFYAALATIYLLGLILGMCTAFYERDGSECEKKILMALLWPLVLAVILVILPVALPIACAVWAWNKWFTPWREEVLCARDIRLLQRAESKRLAAEQLKDDSNNPKRNPLTYRG